MRRWICFGLIVSASLAKAAVPAAGKAHPPYHPQKFVHEKVESLANEIQQRPQRLGRSSLSPIRVETGLQKTAWIRDIYAKNLVEASPLTQQLSDRLLLARLLNDFMGDKATQFYPRTVGLKEFLVKYALLDKSGNVIQDGDKIESALHKEFPSGAIVRPAVGVAPKETGRGMYADMDDFVLDLMKEKSPLYRPDHFGKPARSRYLGAVGSGESIILQENIVMTADIQKRLKSRKYDEIRVHTYEHRVVKDSVPLRWGRQTRVTPEQAEKVEAFVQSFLSLLPPSLVVRQAWGVDVAVMDNGSMRLVDILTNRGKSIQWSSYLEQPRVLGAYTRHFERHYGLEFEGFSGRLIRNNLGNYMNFWGKRIEKSSGLDVVLNLLPPLP